MSSGQTLMALGSLVLLGKLALSTNAFLSDAETMQLQTEAVTTATSLGQSLLEKISVRGYDQNFPGGDDAVARDDLVLPNSLGIDAGEMLGGESTFNDIDDFDYFKDTVSMPRFGNFYRMCTVHYVRESSPYDSVGAATFLKRVDVCVTNSFLVKPNDMQKPPVSITVSRYIAYK